MKMFTLLFNLFLTILFLNVIYGTEEVLSEKVVQISASNYGIMTEKTYPHFVRVIHKPSSITEYKEIMNRFDAIPVILPFFAPADLDQKKRKDIKKYIGMGEHSFANGESGFLYTDGLRDCIALIAFDSATRKSCLYHVSKMELRVNDFGEKLFETHFIPEFLKFFGKDKIPSVILVGSCYSNDLKLLLELLVKYNIKIASYDFPDIAIEESKKIDPESSLTVEGFSNTLIDSTTTTLKDDGRLPSTAVLFSANDGSISISRN